MFIPIFTVIPPGRIVPPPKPQHTHWRLVFIQQIQCVKTYPPNQAITPTRSTATTSNPASMPTADIREAEPLTTGRDPEHGIHFGIQVTEFTVDIVAEIIFRTASADIL
jgi:hypothetical protein